MPGRPGHALAAIAQLVHQRAKRGEALVEVRIIPLHQHHVGHGLAGDRLDLTLPPVGHIERLGNFTGGVVLDGDHDQILFHPQHFGRDLREGLGDPLVDVPVAPRFPHRVDRSRQRVDERVHVRGVEVVLFVPAGSWQDDVGIDAGGRHPEVERDQQVQLSLRRFVVPFYVLGLLLAHFAQILALHAVRRAQQVLKEIFVPLAGRTQQV